MGQNVIQEFVVKLGTQVDNNGFQQMLSLLDSNKMKALGLATALTAATTAVYKFIESATKQELELKKLAAQQHKNVNGLRAQNNALKAMGMTLKDINRDKDLKEIYKDIKKTNEALSLPNMTGVIKNVNALRGAFWKLKSIATYAIQWINYHALNHLTRTIQKITGSLNSVSDWFTKNFNSITSKMGAFIASFARGIVYAFEVIHKIANYIGNLPDGVKRIGTAIAAVIALIKSGPIGQILTLITLIGSVVDDYEAYMSNFDEKTGKWLQPGDKGYTNTALPGIWQYFTAGFTPEAISAAFHDIVDRITETLNGFWTDDLVAQFAGTFFKGDGTEDGEGRGLFGGIIKWLKNKDNQESMANLANALIAFIGETVRNVGGFAGAGIGKLMEVIFDDSAINDKVFTDSKVGSSFAGLMGGFFGGFLSKLGEDGDITEAFKAGLGSGGIGTLIMGLISSVVYDEVKEDGKAKKVINWEKTLESAKQTFMDLGEVIKGMIEYAIKSITDLGSIVFSTLAEVISNQIKGPNKDSALQPISTLFETLGQEGGIFGGAISTGLVSGALFGTGAGIITGLVGFIKGAIENPQQFMSEFNELTASLGKFFSIIWEGTIEYGIDPETGYPNAGKGTVKGGLKNIINKWLHGDGGIEETIATIRNAQGDIIRGAKVEGKGGLLNKLFGYDMGEGDQKYHVLGIFEDLWSRVTEAWGSFQESPVYSWIVGVFDSAVSYIETNAKRVWDALIGKAPDGIKALLGYQASSDVTGVEDGNVELTDSEGDVASYTNLESNGLTTAKVLEDFSDMMDIQGDNSIRFHAQSLFEKAYMSMANSKIFGTNSYDKWAEAFNKNANNPYAMAYLLDMLKNVASEYEAAPNGFAGYQSGEEGKIWGDFGKMVDDFLKNGVPKDWKYPYANEEGANESGKGGNKASANGASPGMSYQGVDMSNPLLTSGNASGLRQTAPDGVSYKSDKWKKAEKDELDSTIDSTKNTKDNTTAFKGNSGAVISATNATSSFQKVTQNTTGDVDELGQTSSDASEELQAIVDAEASYELNDIFDAGASSELKDITDAAASFELSEIVRADASTELKAIADEGASLELSAIYDAEASTEVESLAKAAKSAASELSKVQAPSDGQAWGGRIGSEGHFTVGEDGPEYIIPITKPERAFALLNQMFTEMGTGALDRVVSDFGLNTPGTVGASLGSGVMGGAVINNNFNISAPVNITVYSTAASADDIGSSVFNIAKRHMERTLRGVYA